MLTQGIALCDLERYLPAVLLAPNFPQRVEHPMPEEYSVVACSAATVAKALAVR
jgi:hypothetical protein